MHQSTDLRNSDVIKRLRKVLQFLLAKTLIICTSEAPPRTVKRSSDICRYRDKATGSVVCGSYRIVGAGDFYFLRNIRAVFGDHTASHSLANGVLSRG